MAAGNPAKTLADTPLSQASQHPQGLDYQIEIAMDHQIPRIKKPAFAGFFISTV
jgi:hypothetical protein